MEDPVFGPQDGLRGQAVGGVVVNDQYDWK